MPTSRSSAPTVVLALAAAAVHAALSRDETAAIGQTRGAMCRAVVREMHTEIHKHSLKKNGEDDIYETVPAICLAIVQNYTLTSTPAPSSSWTLLKRAKKLDDEADDGEMPDPESFKHIMTLKKACEAFTDDFQQDLSELMYKETYRKDPEAIIEEFCGQPAVVKKFKADKGGRKRAPGEKPPKAKPKKAPKTAEGAMPSMDEMLKKCATRPPPDAVPCLAPHRPALACTRACVPLLPPPLPIPSQSPRPASAPCVPSQVRHRRLDLQPD